jgi:tagaturonate epimerase
MNNELQTLQMIIEKYSMGLGDRFGLQGEAQLKAVIKAEAYGLNIAPVWNKSNREHNLIGTKPSDVRTEADNAVRALNFSGNYYVDADHINMKNVDNFIYGSDFFTIDVADHIGEKAADEELNNFIEINKKYTGAVHIPGISNPFNVTREFLREIGNKYLFAIKKAAETYKYIEAQKKSFVAEVSMDEVSAPQSPIELFFILSGLAYYKVPVQTIAPKFSGEFYKGIDYVGNINSFAKEYEEFLLIIDYAITEFNLPQNLKLSIHSGSDKFSIYPIIGALSKKHNKGFHLKTAGTTWLEELIGLSLSGKEGAELVKEIYATGYEKIEAFSIPYQTVISIDPSKLPDPETVRKWDGQKLAATLTHDQNNVNYNLHFRQLLHISYSVAADMGSRYLNMLKKNNSIVGECVTNNIFERHIKPLFGLS